MTTNLMLPCSQILSEFDLPPSGIGRLAKIIPLPLVPENGRDPLFRRNQLFFLALVSMRRLLNRILYHLYKSGQSNISNLKCPFPELTRVRRRPARLAKNRFFRELIDRVPTPPTSCDYGTKPPARRVESLPTSRSQVCRIFNFGGTAHAFILPPALDQRAAPRSSHGPLLCCQSTRLPPVSLPSTS